MPPSPISGTRVRFGVFEADLNSGELRKQGVKVKIQEQPFQILIELLEHPGELVSREHLCQKLWSVGTFVDAEVGLNAAIKKLRDALGDSADNPRFIETLPRRGYRFLVEVRAVNGGSTLLQTGGPESSRGESSGDAEAAPVARPPIPAERVSNESTRASLNTPQSVPARQSRSFAPWAAIAFVVFGVLVCGFWLRGRLKPGLYTIGVLPLKNLNATPGSDYFSDGLTDEIIRNLSIVDGLEVRSRTSSFAFKNTDQDVHQIGAKLNASFIVEGSVLRDHDKLRVDVQLIRVADDHPLWSGRYDREAKDIFLIQDEISRSIANELRLNLGQGQRRYNTDLEAYDVYLKAAVLLNGTPGSDGEGIAASIPLFERAIARDPNFAPAYAGIGQAYAYLSATPRVMSPSEAYPHLRDSCEKALQLDPFLAEAHACMGLLYSRDHQWAKAGQYFQRAFQLNPNLSRPRQDYAIWVLLPAGRVDDALAEMNAAMKLDPLSKTALQSVNFVLMVAGRYDEIIKNTNRRSSPLSSNGFEDQLRGRALVQQGRIDEGIAIFEKLGYGSEGFLGYAYGKAGRASDARKIIAAHQEWPWIQALTYAGLGDKDRTIEKLKRMTASGDPRAGFYTQFPEFSLLRSDPRLTEIRKTLDLPAI